MVPRQRFLCCAGVTCNQVNNCDSKIHAGFHTNDILPVHQIFFRLHKFSAAKTRAGFKTIGITRPAGLSTCACLNLCK